MCICSSFIIAITKLQIAWVILHPLGCNLISVLVLTSYFYRLIMVIYPIYLAATWYQSLFLPVMLSVIHLFYWSYFAWQHPFLQPQGCFCLAHHTFLTRQKCIVKVVKPGESTVTLVSLSRGIRTTYRTS